MLFALLATSLVLGYVKIQPQDDFSIGVIAGPGESTGAESSKTLLAESNQEVEIVFSTDGDLKREELDKKGNGLGRFDEIKDTQLTIKVWGDTDFKWSGSLEELDGLKTTTIMPDGHNKIWWDLKAQVGTETFKWSGKQEWNDSLDAGIYTSAITITVVPVGPPLGPPEDEDNQDENEEED
jgi:hypothetical protein